METNPEEKEIMMHRLKFFIIMRVFSRRLPSSRKTLRRCYYVLYFTILAS